jgi:hypothetical protein
LGDDSRIVKDQLDSSEATKDLSGESAAIYIPSDPVGPLRQSEILTGLVQVRLDLTVDAAEGGLEIVDHPYVVVLSQDCDLTQDFEAKTNGSAGSDKLLPSILFCEAVVAQNIRANIQNKHLWRKVVNNKDERYQVLQSVSADEDQLGQGLPALGVDFKRFFTIPRDEVYFRLKAEAKRRCYMSSPYMEHLSARFAYYQCRVALPADHAVD